MSLRAMAIPVFAIATTCSLPVAVPAEPARGSVIRMSEQVRMVE